MAERSFPRIETIAVTDQLDIIFYHRTGSVMAASDRSLVQTALDALVDQAVREAVAAMLDRARSGPPWKVYLDDVRPAPEGWTLVKTVHEAVELTRAGLVEEISLDNDLGDGVWEGWRYCAWLETEAAADPSFVLPKVRMHTSNPVARKRMLDIMSAIARNFPRERLQK